MFLREHTRKIQNLRGVGPKMAGILENMGIRGVEDLLTHYPRDYMDRSRISTLVEAVNQDKATVMVKVLAHDFFGFGAKKTLKVYVEDKSATGTLICFGRGFLNTVLVQGKTFLITGTFRYRFGEIQTSNFEHENTENDSFQKIIPLYGLSAGITQNFIRKILKEALFQLKDTLEDEIPVNIRQKFHLPTKYEALKGIHFPETPGELSRARKTLIFEELFYLQLVIGRKALKNRVIRKVRETIGFNLKNRLLERLPFSLTSDQEKVIGEIESDLFSPYPMNRLVQGDVGCGKTLVAVITALSIIETGKQAAFLAPTELLARQHAEKIADLVEPLGVNVAFLSGNVARDGRENLLKALKKGQVNLIIGTHALFSKDVEYNNLGYVIIDEQHKFGVLQRISLMEKGNQPDLLLMTATPIPRTLALTAFGDLEVSEIKTMPQGRKSIITHLAREGNEQKVYDRVKNELKMGRQAYFVYPLIEESEKLSLKNAETMYNHLKEELFPEFNPGLIHSKIPEDEKRKTMEEFQQKKRHLLVATSVVEVGVDIPNATIMVIEHAERFGLSALHQLRGRVGRGAEQSYAFLIYSSRLTDDGIKRLKVMKETTDGFNIAEEDLKIRGPGQLLGVKQSGFLKLKIADLTRDLSALKAARSAAFDILKKDPGLLSSENEVIRRVMEKAPPFDDLFLNGG